MGSFLVQIKNADVYVGGNLAIKSLSWTINEGENWAVVGNNGSGKTTLMKLIFGELIPIYGGQVHWFGKSEHAPLLEVREKLGYVSAEYQNTYDRPALGWEVVASGFFSSIGLHEQVTPKQKESALTAMAHLGIEYLGNTSFRQMSYGEARRVLLARALVHRTKLLVLDEPCAGLDIPTRERFLNTLEKLSRTSMIYVTHRIEEIMPCITHVLFLKDGKIVAQGKKDEMLNSKTLSHALGCSLTVEKKSDRYWLYSA
ncbi:MAG: ATP-binding cassette domain-containing protein [Nitrospina sp.]|jgi:iron complex transport system ATP-binding protein|nr:ATP-binding cassette domain-containing protein [Nitrospina sp.]MBT3511182.1 ATP-binding cassette domain-containing protein [Nitrospina sp.]MBT3876077.1 ATP-binding cassette domain-containing protein [Nitrospina sp.]MBT4048385.1 ATP-binding cassette domain-containing protein [Nitrospina sp.]MBT4556513.1 ATP-binding cassette domain-containing protein [Nitrospina sp.]